MDEQRRRATALTLVWNLDTMFHTECINNGVTPKDIEPDTEGWYRVGRYAAGRNSAYVQAHRLRKRFTNVNAQVRTVGDQEWKAEVWVRRRNDG